MALWLRRTTNRVFPFFVGAGHAREPRAMRFNSRNCFRNLAGMARSYEINFLNGRLFFASYLMLTLYLIMGVSRLLKLSLTPLARAARPPDVFMSN